MIKEINPIQLAIICDWPKDRAVMYFHRIDYPEIEPHTVSYSRKDLKNWYKSVEQMESVVKLPLRKLIDDVQTNFTANKHCMEYVYKALSKKIVPNEKTGLFPLSISIPDDIGFLITEEQRKLIIERAFDYLPVADQFNITKHKIVIK